MRRATKKTTAAIDTEELTDRLVAQHPCAHVKELHQIAGSLVDISEDLESYLSAGIIEELDDAWQAVERVRDSILHMG
jgi:hypothetical protein